MEQLPSKDEPAVDTRTDICDIHGAYEAKRVYGKIFTRCMLCVEASRQAEAQRLAVEKQAREAATRTRRLEALRAESGLVGRQFRCNFDNYETDSGDQVAILDACRAYVALFRKDEPAPRNSLWLIGMPGTGKSHLGAAMVNHLVETVGIRARMHSTQEIIRLLRATWGREREAPATVWGEDNDDGSANCSTVRPASEAQVIEDLGTCALLVIDEVGVSHGSDAERVQLFEVVDLRYKLERPTVLLSNLTAAQIKDTVGPRIYDRLREGATMKALKWQSYRGEFSRMAKE